MKAVLSGSARTAIIFREDGAFAMRENSKDLAQASVLDTEQITAVGDVRFLDVDSGDISQVRTYLTTLIRADTALQSILALLDRNYTDDVRRGAAKAIDGLIERPEVLEEVRSLLFAMPLPIMASLDSASAICRDLGSPGALGFLNELNAMQTFIACVRNAFDNISMDETERQYALAVATREGVFRRLVRAASEQKSVKNLVPDILKNSVVRTIKQYEGVVVRWADAVTASVAKLAPATNTEAHAVETRETSRTVIAAVGGGAGFASASSVGASTLVGGQPDYGGHVAFFPGHADQGATQNALLLGIDLGTSRSSVVAYNGTRKTVESYVGYPKDPVSRKLLKADIIYGKAALDNRLALDLYRPLEKGVIKGSEDTNNDPERKDKNLQAAKALLRHLVDISRPGRDDLIYGVVGVPSRATQKNKQAILEIAREVLDSVMIVSEPFTVAYGMERMADILVIDIGAGTTDLCRMHGTVPGDEDEISYTIAGDAVDWTLYDLIMERYPRAQITVNMCKLIKEQYGFVSDTKDRVIVTFPEDGKPSQHDVTEEVKKACEILVAPCVEGIQKLVSTFNPEFQDRLRNNILLSGGGALMEGLNTRIEEAMKEYGGAKVTVVDEPLYAGANGALQLAIDMPSEYWQQLK